MNGLRISASVTLSILAIILLSGCSTSFAPMASVDDPVAAAGSTAPIAGSLFGGRQPISGAHIYMFAADTTAYGHASDSLILSYTSGSYPSAPDASGNYYITTNSTGGFSLAAGEYACTPGTQVYIYSSGGNAGAGANAAAGLMAVLGQCQTGGSFTGVTAININEVSTVAAAYALAGYAVDSTHVANAATNAAHVAAGTTTLAKTGLANAFAAAANMYNVSTHGVGVALSKTPNGNGTVPQAEIYTLANILASCINSTSASSPACSALFSNSKSEGSSGTEPSDTATAAINIAHYPGNAVATLFNIPSSNVAPYSPALTTAPNDFTISIKYTGGGLFVPGAMAVDASGNIWIPNVYGNSVTKLSPLGVPASSTGFTGGGLSTPYMIAIDASGDAWITSSGSNVMTKLTSAGVPVSSTGYAGHGTMSPYAVAVDASGNVWVSNYYANSVSKLTSAGTEVTGSPFTYSGADQVAGVAVDNSGNIWLADISSNSVGKLSNGGTVMSGAPYSSGEINAPRFPALDASGHAWIANYGNSSITMLTSTGSGTNYTGGGLSGPNMLGVDGVGNVWAANMGNSTISEFNSSGQALTSSSGYPGTLNTPFSIVIDGSGNAWVANDGDNSVSEFIGVAAPVVTPLVTGTTNDTLGTRP